MTKVKAFFATDREAESHKGQNLVVHEFHSLGIKLVFAFEIEKQTEGHWSHSYGTIPSFMDLEKQTCPNIQCNLNINKNISPFLTYKVKQRNLNKILLAVNR